MGSFPSVTSASTKEQMSRQPLPTDIKDVGFTQFGTIDGACHKRRRGTSIWIPISPPPPLPPPLPETPSPNLPSDAPDYSDPKYFTIYLVRQYQLEGEPLHWAIVVTPTHSPYAKWVRHRVASYANNELRCTHVLQVRGREERMHYEPRKLFVSVEWMDHVHSVYELGKMRAWGGASEEEMGGWELVRSIARAEEPPKSESWSEIAENGQGWCVRIVKRLVERGLVEARWIEAMEGMMEPL